MTMRLILASTLLVALLVAAPATAAPKWTQFGKSDLPRYGSAQLYIGKLARHGDQAVSGELRAVLDEPWNNPDASGTYTEVFFRVRANCRERTIAVQPIWPESPRTSTVRDEDMHPAPSGSGNENLLKAYCGG
jgi:hypothetical protein